MGYLKEFLTELLGLFGKQLIPGQKNIHGFLRF